MLERWWIVPCLASTLFVSLPQTKPAPPRPRKAMLQPKDYDDADRIPPILEHEVKDRVPEALVKGSHRVQARDDRLEIDVTGDGEIDVVVHAGKPRVVGFTIGEARRPILFYRKIGTWCAAPGGGLEGKIESMPVEALDADLDGDFAGSADYIRWGDGAFTRHHENRLLAGDHELWRYSLRNEGGRWAFEVTIDPRPAQANDLQWSALMAANRFRRQIGLAPMRLDLARSAACRKHAEYLLQNPTVYYGAWDGVGPHDEQPELPGFSEEGRRAAQQSSITSQWDPVRAVSTDPYTMLHRVNYLCSASEGFGVGCVVQGDETSRKGFSVMWTGWETTKDTAGPVLVPGAGQRRVPTTCVAEIPAVESPADFYSKPRGYPISVTFAEMPLTKIALRLFADAGATFVRGTCFTPASPVHSSRPQNARSAFFVADQPLKRAHRYVAVFTAVEGERQIRLVWGFATE